MAVPLCLPVWPWVPRFRLPGPGREVSSEAETCLVWGLLRPAPRGSRCVCGCNKVQSPVRMRAQHCSCGCSPPACSLGPGPGLSAACSPVGTPQREAQRSAVLLLPMSPLPRGGRGGPAGLVPAPVGRRESQGDISWGVFLACVSTSRRLGTITAKEEMKRGRRHEGSNGFRTGGRGFRLEGQTDRQTNRLTGWLSRDAVPAPRRGGARCLCPVRVQACLRMGTRLSCVCERQVRGQFALPLTCARHELRPPCGPCTADPQSGDPPRAGWRAGLGLRTPT